MIETTQGDILKSDAQAVVNTVNCVGVMGRGIALQFKKAFPENFKAYKDCCNRKELHPGMMFVFDTGKLQSPRYIINFPTKRHWKGKSKLEDIQKGLSSLAGEIRRLGITSIAIAPLGCGLGGLNWQVVRPMIERTLAPLENVHIFLYEPKGAPEADGMINRTKRPGMTPGRTALLGLMRRYLAGLMDVSISLLEIHKLMYFMQVAGEKLRLNIVKGPYGPYAKNLRHVLSHIEGHFITGFGDGKDDPERQIECVPEAVEEAEKFLENHPGIRDRFDRVVDLIDGFENPYGMELLATVHWVAANEHADTPEKAVRRVHNWNDRKRRIPSRHILVAWDILEQKGWIGNSDG